MPAFPVLAERVRFLGAKAYGVLKDYARSFDVAILPYAKREPTFSGSPTRFYEHLAACRPKLATRGVEQLLQKEPLVRLVKGADDLLGALQQLRAANFQDGFEQIGWAVSRRETWLDRAQSMVDALDAIRPVNTARPVSPMKVEQGQMQWTELQHAIISSAQGKGKTKK